MKLIYKSNVKFTLQAAEIMNDSESIFRRSYMHYLLRSLKISLSDPYETLFIPHNSIKPDKCRFVKSGLKFFILNNKVPVSAIDFIVSKGKLSFSHFTFGGSVDGIVQAVTKIQKIRKYPGTGFNMKIVKCAVLGLYALKLDSSKQNLYFILNSENKMNGLSEKQFNTILFQQKDQLHKLKMQKK